MRARSILAVLALSAAVTAFAQPPRPGERRPPPPPTPEISAERSLMVTALGVVEDPARTDATSVEPGAWTFRHLIEQMAGANDPSEFALRWLRTWTREHPLNGGPMPPREAIEDLVIAPWLAASGGEHLDLAKAPFKLLAIVNRLDLRVHDEGELISAGEGRFIFGVLDPDGQPLPPIAGTTPGGFLVIFEYGLPATGMRDLGRWVKDWADLSALQPGSEEYNDHLERLTRRFTDADAAPGKPNGSALNQVRTNEVALALPWELREFVIDYRSGLLRPHTVALTPDTYALNGTETLARLINANQERLVAGTFDLPETWFGGTSASGPFLPEEFPDFDARTFTTSDFFPPFLDIPWSAAGIEDNDARHAFALNTCNGCHRDETGTGFVQVAFPDGHALPESLGEPAALAGFLTGTEVADPVDPATTRVFADLERRRDDLLHLIEQFARDPRGPSERHRPRFVH